MNHDELLLQTSAPSEDASLFLYSRPNTCWWVALIVLTWCAGMPAAAQDADTLLTLDEAVEHALARNYDVRIARNEADIAANDYSLGNAGFLPSVGATAQQDQLAGEYALNASANLRYTLFDGLGRFATYRRLAAESAQQAFAERLTTETTLADVVIAYYDLARQQQQLDVLQGAIDISEERLAIAELRLDVGSAAEQEVRLARVALNEDRAALLRQRSALTDAKAAFNRLLARPGGLDYSVADTIPIDTTLDLPPLMAAARQQNPELRLNERALDAAQAARREIRAEWLPSIDLTAGYAFNDLAGTSSFVRAQDGFTYGLTATLDLFNGFNRQRRLENAQLRIRNNELLLEEARTRVFTSLENAYVSYRNNLDLVALEAENRDLAALNVEVALESFRLGTITSVELREVQNALTRAESQLLNARFAAKRAATELQRLSGQLQPTLR